MQKKFLFFFSVFFVYRLIEILTHTHTHTATFNAFGDNIEFPFFLDSSIFFMGFIFFLLILIFEFLSLCYEFFFSGCLFCIFALLFGIAATDIWTWMTQHTLAILHNINHFNVKRFFLLACWLAVFLWFFLCEFTIYAWLSSQKKFRMFSSQIWKKPIQKLIGFLHFMIPTNESTKQICNTKEFFILLLLLHLYTLLCLILLLLLTTD